MKKILSCIAFSLLALNSTAFADDLFTLHKPALFAKDSKARIFVAEEGNFFNQVPYNFKLEAPNRATMIEFGNGVTSPERLQKLAELQAANYAMKHGFAYFDFTITKKSITCKNKLTSEWYLSPTVNAASHFSNSTFKGAINAAALLNADATAFSADATTEEKDAAFEMWQATCFTKYPPQTIFDNKLAHVVIDSAIKAVFHL